MQERIKTSRSIPHTPYGVQREKIPPTTKTSKSHVQDEQPWSLKPSGTKKELFQVNILLEKKNPIVDTPGSSLGFHEKKPQITTYGSVGPSSEDNLKEQTPDFHTLELGKSLGKEVE